MTRNFQFLGSHSSEIFHKNQNIKLLKTLKQFQNWAIMRNQKRKLAAHFKSIH